MAAVAALTQAMLVSSTWGSEPVRGQVEPAPCSTHTQ